MIKPHELDPLKCIETINLKRPCKRLTIESIEFGIFSASSKKFFALCYYSLESRKSYYINF